MNNFALVLFAGMLAILSGCQQTSRQSNESPQSMMVRVATQAQACWWFKGNDPAFGKFRMAAEINSPAGRPRILIVPKDNPAGLPKLVVQAQRVTGITGVATFGPLLDSRDGMRIQEDVSRWAGGGTAC